MAANIDAPNLHKGVLHVDANEPVVVYTTKNLAEAEILKNVLEGEGIREPYRTICT
jgi:hypothetical protein